MLELALVFLRLGVTAFGGPAAHLAMMEEEVVRRRRWLTHEQFLDLLGATNLIPGPNSTEMAIHLGLVRAGSIGLLVAGAYLAVGAAISALTKNQVIAFVLAVAVCFLFAAAGSPVVTEFLSARLPVLAEVARGLSITDRLGGFSRGVVALPDLGWETGPGDPKAAAEKPDERDALARQVDLFAAG